MRYLDRQKSRPAIAITRAATGSNQFVDIVTLSLVGLIFAVMEITHYAGTGTLQAMFAQ
jgi:hypothetical protein